MFGFATRNLLRNPRRSISTLISIALGVFALLVFFGLREDLVLGIRTFYVRTAGHLQIQHRDFFSMGLGNPTAYGIDHAQDIISSIYQSSELRPNVAIATPKLQFGGIAGNFLRGTSRTVFGEGFVALDAERMGMWDEYGLRQEDDIPVLVGQPDDAAVVGRGVARVLQLCARSDMACMNRLPPAGEVVEEGAGNAPSDMPDDIAELAGAERFHVSASQSYATMELLVPSPQGMPNVAATQVIAAQILSLKELDDTYVGVQLPLAQRLVYGSRVSRATSIHIQLHRTSDMESVKMKMQRWLEQKFPDQPLVVRDYIELYPAYEQVVKMFNVIFGFVAILIALVVTYSASSTMSMMVMERTVEVGTLRAIGFQQSWVQSLFLREALILGTVGAITGVLLSWAAQYVVNGHLGLQWQPPGKSVALPLHVRIWGEWAVTVGVAAGATALACISSWIPARRASRVTIVAALRHT
ncbi:putative ABC transport system permease protein [Burkholderia ambifaria]|nr:FtsX-like permease family protein [Burkholderia ambifaria]MDR6504205.1 putative ABC transport system permease protein [Burkholderia ambifaria]